MLPFAVSFFFSSVASALMPAGQSYALPAGFVLQVIGFGIVALCARYQLRGIEEGLACAGIGYGIVMPGIIKAVIGDIDERHAGLASGMVMTALQIGSALGIAIVGGFFYISLGRERAFRPTPRVQPFNGDECGPARSGRRSVSMASRRETNYSCALTDPSTQPERKP